MSTTRRSQEEPVLSVLRVVGPVLTVLFLLFCLGYPLLLDGPVAVALSVAAGVSGAVTGAVAVAARRCPAAHAEPLAAAGALVVVANPLLHMVLAANPVKTSTVMLVVVGLGVVLVRLRYLAVTVAVVVLAWLGCALAVGAPARADWAHWVIGMTMAVVLSATLHLGRRRLLRDLLRARDDARDAAVRDDLTGLANRRGLAMLGTQILETARRQGDAAHCAFLDVDGFKSVNDTLGHDAGDDVLVAVAEALRAVTRTTDVVARWGGDEFAVIGPGPGMSALDLERRVHDQLATDPPVRPDVWRPRVTVGGAVLAPWDSGTLETLLGRADREMYARRTLRRTGLRTGRPAAAPD